MSSLTDSDAQAGGIRSVHVATNISDPGAGTSYAIDGICSALARRGTAVELHSLEPLPSVNGKPYRLIGYQPSLIGQSLGASSSMRKGILDAARAGGVVHNHGLWRMPNLYAGWAAQKANRRLLWSPHGMLAPSALRHSALSKRLFDRAAQSATLARADCFHATSAGEYEDIRKAGHTQPVSIVPLGVDIPPESILQAARSPERTLLFMGRLHPIKRIDVIISAWSQVERQFPEWRLAICGPDSNAHLAALRRLATDLRVARVSFLEPRFDDEKSKLLAHSDLLVLMSESENFGLVVAESLAHGTPAIAATTTPWSGLNEHACGWSISPGADSLAECLRQSLASSDAKLRSMGQRGREWMIRAYSWDAIGEMLSITYDWLAGNGERPAWIRMD